jgi:hypothetical protein
LHWSVVTVESVVPVVVMLEEVPVRVVVVIKVSVAKVAVVVPHM